MRLLLAVLLALAAVEPASAFNALVKVKKGTGVSCDTTPQAVTGSGNYTVPANCTKTIVSICGTGGAGGDISFANGHAGGGGGSADCWTGTFSTAAGTVIAYTVAAQQTTCTTDGGNSNFGTKVTAGGGKHGVKASAANNAGGAGGTVTTDGTATSVTDAPGVAGGASSSSAGQGGGGGGAGISPGTGGTGNGSTGFGGTGGTAGSSLANCGGDCMGAGGVGGDNRGSTTPGQPGTGHGSGGGGANSSGSSPLCGYGASGKLVLTPQT